MMSRSFTGISRGSPVTGSPFDEDPDLLVALRAVRADAVLGQAQAPDVEDGPQVGAEGRVVGLRVDQAIHVVRVQRARSPRRRGSTRCSPAPRPAGRSRRSRVACGGGGPPRSGRAGRAPPDAPPAPRRCSPTGSSRSSSRAARPAPPGCPSSRDVSTIATIATIARARMPPRTSPRVLRLRSIWRWMASRSMRACSLRSAFVVRSPVGTFAPRPPRFEVLTGVGLLRAGGGCWCPPG